MVGKEYFHKEKTIRHRLSNEYNFKYQKGTGFVVNQNQMPFFYSEDKNMEYKTDDKATLIAKNEIIFPRVAHLIQSQETKNEDRQLPQCAPKKRVFRTKEQTIRKCPSCF